MNDYDTLTECPICEGELQTTDVVRTYNWVDMAYVRKGELGNWYIEVTDSFPAYDDSTVETTVYCDNDHTEQEMLAFLNLSVKENN